MRAYWQQVGSYLMGWFLQWYVGTFDRYQIRIEHRDSTLNFYFLSPGTDCPEVFFRSLYWNLSERPCPSHKLYIILSALRDYKHTANRHQTLAKFEKNQNVHIMQHCGQYGVSCLSRCSHPDPHFSTGWDFNDHRVSVLVFLFTVNKGLSSVVVSAN